MLERLPWPVPALLAWAASWALYWALRHAGLAQAIALALAAALGLLLSLAGNSWWRRLMIAAGFPVSVAISGAAVLPSWGWLVLLVVVALVYPVNAWRDAPLFPTPAKALQALPTVAPLAPGAALLDAGCGLGHGLVALRAAYPQAQLHGIEWSWPLRALCAVRCPWARVRRADIWRVDWARFELVYLFQRPESMPRAVAKASADMPAGRWLVSLEFEARELEPTAILTLPDGRALWLYRQPFVRRSGSEATDRHK